MTNLQPRKGFRSPATLATVALAVGSGSAMSAVLTFIAPYQVNPPANGVDTETAAGTSSETFGAWTGTFVNATGAATRAVTTTSAPTSLQLLLSNSSISSVPVDSFSFFATIPLSAAAGFASFDYSYSESSDPLSTAAFSYLRNGSPTTIATTTNSGSVSFAVNPGDTFGFQLNGSYFINTSVMITNFTAPVPEPSALLLLATGFTGIIGMRRRRQHAAA